MSERRDEMDAMTAIHTRRSIRKYTNEPVPDELVEEVLRAAMMAPSAGNQQPWHFIVIRDRELLDSIPEVHPHSKMIPGAPMAIMVCGDLRVGKHKELWVQDCSAATQNLLLAAHAKGLGAVWLGVFPYGDRVEGLRRIFEVPEHMMPFSLVPIGWPNETKPEPERYDPARVHQDRW
jgi:nitroreductase